MGASELPSDFAAALELAEKSLWQAGRALEGGDAETAKVLLEKADHLIRWARRAASMSEPTAQENAGDEQTGAEALKANVEARVRGLEAELRDATQGQLPSDVQEERRRGVADRRSSQRPWRVGSPGRRREDKLREELGEARRELEEAEARLSASKVRQDATG